MFVQHEHSAPRTPQQMGHVERVWRTAKEGTRATLHHAQLPAAAWERAMASVLHVMNRMPTQRHPNTTPYELFTGKQASHAHLRVFGCTAYPLDKQYRTSLQPTSEVGIHMGYDKGGWVLYIPARKQFLVSNACRFNESCHTKQARAEAQAAFAYAPTPRV